MEDEAPRYQARLRSNSPLTWDEAADEIRELVFELEDEAFSFEVGQSIAVIVPGPHDAGHAEHVRFYTIADAPLPHAGKPEVSICVRRCDYLDEFSGERYQGIASKYLCELEPGAQALLAGPVGDPFEVPEDKSADLLLIGIGTGIAPFRGFLRHIYRNLGGWQGRVRLFYGARTGLELAYMNDHQNDIAEYLDEDTFRAIEALSPRPHWGEPPALADALKAHEQEVWAMLEKASTCVYVAGLASLREALDEAFATMAGSPEQWQRRKAELIAGGRWTELCY